MNAKLPFSFLSYLAAISCCFAGLISSVAAQPSAAPDKWAVAAEGALLDRLGVLPNSPTLIKSLGDAAEYVTRWQLPVDAEGWSRRRPEAERASLIAQRS